MRYWLHVPYLLETSPGESGASRRLAIDEWTSDISQFGGYWSETEIDGGDVDKDQGGSALVLVRSSGSTATILKKEFTEVSDPKDFWPEGGLRKEPSGKLYFPVRPVEGVLADVWTDTQKSQADIKVAELISKADKEGYIKLTGLPWGEASKLLAMAGKQGYGLDRISTGTFPTTSVLTNFTGANEDPLSESGAWNTTNPPLPATGFLERVSNTAKASFSANEGAITTASYGPNSETFFTVSTKPPTNDYVYIHVRKQTTDYRDGYVGRAQVQSAGSDIWLIRRYDDVTGTQLGATSTQEFSSGDKVGIEALGSDISAYLYTAGAWSLVLTRSDSAYSGVGYLGLGMSSSTTVGDDFGGGTIISASLKGNLSLLGVGG